MKVLVTGGCGFVGSHLIDYLVKKKYRLIVVDNCKSGDYSRIKKYVKEGKVKFYRIDIRNLVNLMKVPKVDVVIHLAAVASVIESIKNPVYVNDVNVNGTLNVLEFCKRKKIKKIIFTSSAAIFGEYEEKIYENLPAIPTTIYGSSKLVGEQYCRVYSKLYGMKIIVFRPFNIYGLRQNPSYAGVISRFLEKLERNKRPIIFGDGKQTRDFIHVKDLVIFFELGIRKKMMDDFAVFNLATGKSSSINDLAKIMTSLSKKKSIKPIHKAAIPVVVIKSSASIKKLKSKFRIFPKITLRSGLSELIAEYSSKGRKD